MNENNYFNLCCLYIAYIGEPQMFYSLGVLSAMTLTERNTNLNMNNLTINKMLSKYVQ